jgi:D-arginine dehydrogenase
MEEWDAIIIGGGIAGASAAFELAGARRVVVLEQEAQAGVHATGRSAAVFIEPYGNEVVQALTAASKAFFYGPPRGFCDVPLLRDRELYIVATAEQEELLRAAFATLSKRFPQLRLVKGTELEARIPSLRRGRITAALHDPGTKEIDVDALLQGYLRGASGRGAQLRTRSEVTAIQRRQEAWEVETSTGAHRAPVLVNAAGAWVERIAALAGARGLGLTPLQRSMFVVDPGHDSGVREWPLVGDLAEQWYFKPESGRLLGSPSEEDVVEPCDAAPDDLTIATGVDRLEQVLDLEVRHIESKWAGLRTFAADRSPVVGFDPEAEGFFWLAGQGGFGIQTAPAMGRLTAALIGGGDVPEDLQRLGITAEILGPGRLCPG